MRIRMAVITTVIAAGSIFVAAPPAQAYCHPDNGTGEPGCGDCDTAKLNDISRKLIGEDLFLCPA